MTGGIDAPPGGEQKDRSGNNRRKTKKTHTHSVGDDDYDETPTII